MSKVSRSAAFCVLGLSTLVGCQTGNPPRRAFAANEPSLGGQGEPGPLVADAPTARSANWTDRHPLFTKPRDYYASSGNNKVVKTAAATVIGVPAGIYGEIKQIVVGAPSNLR